MNAAAKAAWALLALAAAAGAAALAGGALAHLLVDLMTNGWNLL
jgi:hypothetical protein